MVNLFKGEKCFFCFFKKGLILFKMINKNNIQNNKIINQNKIIKRNIKNIINVDLLNNIKNNQMINKSIKNLFIKKIIFKIF